MFYDYQDFVASRSNMMNSRSSGRGRGSSSQLNSIVEDADADNFSGAEDDMSD